MELLRTLGALLEPPSESSDHLQALADLLDLGPLPSPTEHTDVFQFQLYPYASVYLGEDGMLGGEARDRIAGFWRILGLEPPLECDHLTVMLTYLAALEEALKEAPEPQRERWQHLRATFLHEHLLSWLPPWLARLDDLAPPFYQRWGTLLQETLRLEAEAHATPEEAPSFLQRAPGIADPRLEGLEAFLDSLLAPVRSGLLIVRDDLRHAARQLDLGVRLAERKFVLKALLMQNAVGVLDWLAEEARAWSERHRRLDLAPPPVVRQWSERAAASARLLDELAAERRPDTV